jgi:hypothetical protein
MMILRVIKKGYFPSVIALLLSSHLAVAAPSCKDGFQARGEVCVSQKMSDYIACLEASGGNKQEIATEFSSAVKDSTDTKVKGTGSGVIIKADGSLELGTNAERSIFGKLSSKFYAGAMAQCETVLKLSSSEQRVNDMVLELEKGAGFYTGPVTNGRPNGQGILRFKKDGLGRDADWIYAGDFIDGEMSGNGEFTSKADKIAVSGSFRRGSFVSGTGSLDFDARNEFSLMITRPLAKGDEKIFFRPDPQPGTTWPLHGKYDGEVINLQRANWADGRFWRKDVVPHGKGVFRGSRLRWDVAEPEQWTWEGSWVDGGFVGKGRVTFPDGGYEEGLFHYMLLVEGTAHDKEYSWGVLLDPPSPYSGAVRDGMPVR